MRMKWISVREYLPQDGEKVYYFCEHLGIFRGEFHILKSSYANPNKFSSNHGVLDSDDVSYWMPYDHTLRDMIPLPPDYTNKNMEIFNNSQSFMNSGLDINVDEIETETTTSTFYYYRSNI